MASLVSHSFLRSLYTAGPYLFTVLIILVARVPFQDAAAGPLIPIFSLIYTYYFRLHFPQAAGLVFIFLLGLLEDYLSGGYLGMTPLVLLLVAALFERRRNLFTQGTFVTETIIFVFFSLGVSLLYWLLTSFVEASLLPVMPFVIQGLVTALAFPFYVLVVSRLFRRYAR